MELNIFDFLSQNKEQFNSEEINFSPEFLQNFWKELIKELKNKDTPLLNNIIVKNSLIDFITSCADLPYDEDMFSKLFKQLREVADNENYYWNQSIQKTIYYLIDTVEKQWGKDDTVFIEETNITGKDIKQADAGYSFMKYPWVKPQINIDKKSYDDIRNEDKVINALKNTKNLQFTRKYFEENDTLYKYLRLLMPQNSRRIEIEDLNRNFWVIGQCIEALSSYIWGDNAILPSIFNKLINEITQLWENVLYLWTELSLLSQNKTGGVHIEVFPLTNSEFECYNKYDNFDEIVIPSPEEVQLRINHLSRKYKCNILAVPFLRCHNYQKNYYSKEIYPYIFYFNQATNQWTYQILKDNNGKWITITLEDENNLYDYDIFGIREEEGYYKYIYPFHNINEVFDNDVKRYYGCLRVIPEIECSTATMQIKKFNLKIYDAAARAIQNKEEVIAQYSIEDFSNTNSQFENNGKEILLNFNYFGSSNLINYTIPQILDLKSNKFYLGELSSWYKKTKTPQFKNAEFQIVKIGDFYPEEFINPSNNNEAGYINFESVPQNYNEEGGLTFDTATYGLGAYALMWGKEDNQKYKIPDSNNDKFRHLKFVNYNYLRYQNQAEDAGQFKTYDGNNLNIEILNQLSLSYITNLKEDAENKVLGEKEVPGLYATKLGIGYWSGENGSQWSYGLVNALIYWSGTEAYLIGQPKIFDGYWTKDEKVFTVKGSQWRRLSFRCDSLNVKEDIDNLSFDMKGGQIVWYDHWKDIEGNIEPINSRPRANMNINSQNELIFSNPINPLGSNTAMALQFQYNKDIPFYTNGEDERWVHQLYNDLLTTEINGAVKISGISNSQLQGSGSAVSNHVYIK